MNSMNEILERFRLNLGIKRFLNQNLFVQAFVRSVLTRRRLKLPSIELSEIADVGSSVLLRTLPLNLWDTSYNDIVAICAIAKAVRPRRILEIGTARGRTTLCLSDNCPDAQIVTYDIDPNAGAYFRTLNPCPANIALRITDVQNDSVRLRADGKFDFIFVDANHVESCVRADANLSLDLLEETGVILWHDYANSDYLFGYNRVPEVLAELAAKREIYGVVGTELAIYRRNFVSAPSGL
jgi:hypothetical protein